MRAERTHVLFDLDGTLSESEPGIVASLRHAFALEGVPVPSPELLRATIGPPFEIGLPAAGVPSDRLAAVITRYREHYEADGLFDTRLYEGVMPMLDALAAEGLVLAIATSKPETSAQRVVEHLGLTSYFAAIAGATYGPTRRSKAEVIDHALSTLGIEPGDHAVMVGDREHDVLGARLHGIDAIGVLWGYGSRTELAAAGATAIAATPADVVELVGAAARPDDMAVGAVSPSQPA